MRASNAIAVIAIATMIDNLQIALHWLWKIKTIQNPPKSKQGECMDQKEALED